MPPKRIEFLADQCDDITRRYLSGESPTTIAPDHNCSVQTIYRVLRDEGIEIRKAGGSKKKITEDELEFMDWLYWGEGWSQAEIAKALGIKPTSVSSRFRQNGIPTRSRSELNRRVWANMTPEERTARARKQWDGLSDEEKRRQKAKLAEFSRARARSAVAA